MCSVGAVVLNWNDYNSTRNCVESVTQLSKDIEIVIVDNGSSDGSGKKLSRYFNNKEVIINEDNKGFAGGMNVGILHLINKNKDIIWLLNNDVVVPSSLDISEIINTFTQAVGIVTPVIKNKSGDSISFIQGSTNSSTGKVLHEEQPISRESQTLPQNDYVPFCSTFINSDVFRDVGLLPEKYFLYYEDVDFCTSVKKCGYKILTQTNEEVIHEVSSSTGSHAGSIYSYYNYRNQLLFGKRFEEFRLFPGYFLTVLPPLAKRVYFTEIEGIFYMLYGIFDGLRNKSGRGPVP